MRMQQNMACHERERQEWSVGDLLGHSSQHNLLKGPTSVPPYTWRNLYMKPGKPSSSNCANGPAHNHTQHTHTAGAVDGLSWQGLYQTSACHLLGEIEEIIKTNLLPSLTGRLPLNNIERNLLGLPARLGGIGLLNPSTCNHYFDDPRKITEPLQEAILSPSQSYPTETISQLTASEQTGHPKGNTRQSKVTIRGN